MDIQAEAVCLYKCDGSPSVVASLACACCEDLCEITAFVWIKYPGCCFRHSCVLIRLQTTYHLKQRTCNTVSNDLKYNRGCCVLN